VDTEQHAKVPGHHIEEGAKLGIWVSGLRGKRGSLGSERIAELDALGFVWDFFVDNFRYKIDYLKRFADREGHAKVPAKHVENGVKIGIWAAGLRTKRAKRATIPPDLIAQLDALGFDWSIRPAKSRPAEPAPTDLNPS
jgi:hypothetical protein